MSQMGIKVDNFKVPVCNSFKAKILNDQLCYEVDVNEYSLMANLEKELKWGLNFIMDYNSDRHVVFDNEVTDVEETSLASSMVESDDNQRASIFLHTVGGKVAELKIII